MVVVLALYSFQDVFASVIEGFSGCFCKEGQSYCLPVVVLLSHGKANINIMCEKAHAVLVFVFLPLSHCRPVFGVGRDGRAHCYCGSNTEGTTEWTERRGNTIGDGQVPFCVFGQGLSVVIISARMGQCIDFAVALMAS